MIRIALIFLCLSVTGAQAAHHRHHHGGRLPWCGMFMMDLTGIHKPGLALARSWAHEGHDAGGPAPGVIVVWPHHVGRIERQAENGEWLVLSGNDGNRVRTRARSMRGAIAFRRV